MIAGLTELAPAPLLGLAATLVAFTLVWLVSVARTDASIVDIFWGPGFVVVAWLYRDLSTAPPVRGLLVALLVTLWGGRLALHILTRNAGHGEDFRYRAMREGNPGFTWRSLYLVFWLQAVILWVVAMPLYVVQRQGGPELGWIDGLAGAVFVIGFLFEAVGDLQLRRFKADPANRGAVMDRGLWRYSRHPNYFGDAVVWWGLGLFAVAAGGAWAVVGPLVMTVLLLKVSGVSLLEKSLEQTKPRYRDYVRRTSAFLPRPPRRLE